MRRQKHPFRKLLLWLAFIAILPFAFAVLYRFVPVPLTPLMVQRLFEGEGLSKKWTPLNKISPAVTYSVVAAEDNLFCQHNGFDWKALQSAFDDWQAAQLMDAEDAKVKGGSTISQQTAKNVFLLTVQSPVRKALELPLTVAIEKIWGKRRIMEIYLNVAEWGPGIYGVEAAAQHYFKTSAKNLTWHQGALLAAVLPSPRKWKANPPGPYVAARAGRIQGRISQLGPLLDCVRIAGVYPPMKKAASPAAANGSKTPACPNCPKSKQPAGASSLPLPESASSTLPSATPNSGNPSPLLSPNVSPAPSSPVWNDVPNTSSQDLAPATPSCSTSACPEASPSLPVEPSLAPAGQNPQPMVEPSPMPNTTTSSSPSPTL